MKPKQREWEKELQDIFNELEMGNMGVDNFSEAYKKTYQLFLCLYYYNGHKKTVIWVAITGMIYSFLMGVLMGRNL